jgi:hypothetical protein
LKKFSRPFSITKRRPFSQSVARPSARSTHSRRRDPRRGIPPEASSIRQTVSPCPSR